MQKKLNFFTKLGFLLTALAGTFLHFLYGLTGKTLWTGLFSSINESVWAHMKLVFFPLTAYFIFECLRLGSKVPALVSASPWGILSGTFSVPVVFLHLYRHPGPSYYGCGYWHLPSGYLPGILYTENPHTPGHLPPDR